jgi:hypothetical protein
MDVMGFSVKGSGLGEHGVTLGTVSGLACDCALTGLFVQRYSRYVGSCSLSAVYVLHLLSKWFPDR